MWYRIGYAATVLWECLRLYGLILIGRERLDLPRFGHDSYDLSLVILPGVTTIAVAIGLILGIQSASLLQTINVPQLALSQLASAVVNEFAPLLVGILVASRAGVELAVRIGGMLNRHEIDGLIVSGINPVHFTVGATLLAVLLMSMALAVWAQLMMLAASGLWLAATDAVPAGLFLNTLSDTISATDLLLSIGKALLFALLVTLIAATEGGTTSQRPGGISQAASRTMLQGIAWILVVDVLFAVGRS